MPNHFPKLFLAISPPCAGLDVLVLPRPSCWEDSRPPPTTQFQLAGNVEPWVPVCHSWICPSTETPIHTCAQAWIQTNVRLKSAPSLTRQVRSILSSHIQWWSLRTCVPSHVTREGIPPKIRPRLFSWVLAQPGQRHRFRHMQLGTPAKSGFQESCPRGPQTGHLSEKPNFASVPSCMCLNRFHSVMCSWVHRWSQPSSKGIQRGPRLDTIARSLTSPECQTTRLNGFHLHRCSWAHRWRRASSKDVQGGPRLDTFARSLALPVCQTALVQMKASHQVAPRLSWRTWADLRKDGLPGYVWQDASAKVQPLDVTGWDASRLACQALMHSSEVHLPGFRFVCVWMGVSVDGPIHEWQTGTQSLTFLINWDWLMGGGLVSSQQDCLGKTGISRP